MTWQKDAPVLVVDTETTGLDYDDHIWEIAALRRDSIGRWSEWHTFVEHDLEKAARLPDPFREDHDRRYDPETALPARGVAQWLELVAAPDDRTGEVLHVVGAVPNFDTERLARLLRYSGKAPQWHYHLIDVETLAVGYLCGRLSTGHATDTDAWRARAREALRLPWDSDVLSRAVGVEPPPESVRHTAMGDVRWALSLYDVVMGDQS